MIEIPQKPEEALNVLSSLSRFAVLSETRGMRDWLKSELARLDAANRIEVDKTVFRQRQGACQVLEKLFQFADTSDGKIDQIRKNIKK
jgi:hypothetical protein